MRAGEAVTREDGPRCPEHGEEARNSYPDGDGGMLHLCPTVTHWWRVPKADADV